MAGYGDDAGFIGWLAANGYSLPAGALSPAVLRQRGSAYVDGTYGARFRGAPTGGYAQERSWPRSGATTTYGGAVPDDVIPAAVVAASYAAGWYEAQSPGTLAAISTGAAPIKREKVGPLETEYAVPTDAGGLEAVTPSFLEVEGLLAPYIIPTTPQPFGILAVGPGTGL